MRTKPYATASALSSAGRQWNFQPFKIDLVATRVGLVATRSALSLTASQRAASHEGAECLIIPGGYGARRAALDAEFLGWLGRAASAAELVAAIGNGVWLLAQTGLLGDAQVAASPDLAQEIRALCPSARPNSKDTLCVSDKFLSARKSALGLDLSCEIVARCFGKKLASSLSAELGIDWSGEFAAVEIVPCPV